MDVKERLRFILWTRLLNQRIRKSGYVPHAPLRHISAYIDAVLQRFAACRDAHCSFFQVPIPSDRRHLFVFADDEGNLWQFTRLPMGLVTAPEIMHLRMCVAAGHPDYVRPEFAARDVTVDVWIDNVRFAGEPDDVRRAAEAFDSVAAAAHMTLNHADAVEGTKYTFLGVHFDHEAGAVQLGEKIARKLRRPTWTTIGEVEQLIGRLLHAAAVLDIPLVRYWWLLKGVRRRLSAVNRGAATRASPANLSKSVLAQLRELVAAARNNAPRLVTRPGPVTTTIFTDATLTSWGAVCIDMATQEVRVAGARWRVPATNINAAETRAIQCALEAFPVTDCTLRLYVDNTSTMASVKKARARSFAINTELQPVLETAHARRCKLTVSYVASADNPADAPSRGAPFSAAHHATMQRAGGAYDVR